MAVYPSSEVMNETRYLSHSLERLAVMADKPFTWSKQGICKMLREYGHILPDTQREALERWCKGLQ